MKKFLLFVAGVMLAVSAKAQPLSEPLTVPGATFTAMSPNGVWAAGENMFLEGCITIINLETLEGCVLGDEFGEEYYTLGMGANSISNDGIVLFSPTMLGTAAYWQNGEITMLPIPEGVTSAFSNAITPDGSRIAGMLGVGMTLEEQDVPMQRPVIWNRQADGTYSDPIELPYPQRDVTGRVPQYILIDGISDDGKTLVGQQIDNSGWLSAAPLVFTEGEDGTWTYKFLGENFLNPTGVEIPEDLACENPEAIDYLTGDNLAAYEATLEFAATLVEPDPKDYMGEEELALYEAYIEENGWAPWDLSPYMSEEKLAEYNEAVDFYWANVYISAESFLDGEDLEAYDAALAKYIEFSTLYEELSMSQEVNFQMNAITMSLNGKYVGVAGDYVEWVTINDPFMGEFEQPVEFTKAYIFDVETGEYQEKTAEGFTSIIPTYIANDGRLLCAQPFNFFSGSMPMALYAESFEAPLRPLQDVVRESNPELYAYMEENMFQTVVSYDVDEEGNENEIETQMWVTGVPCSNADMSLVATWAVNYESEDILYTYFMPMGETLAIEEVGEDSKVGEEIRHNLNGQRVGKDYKGIVISGKKIKVIK